MAVACSSPVDRSRAPARDIVATVKIAKLFDVSIVHSTINVLYQRLSSA
jgi:hypothetical protein